MYYALDKDKFKRRLFELGYVSLSAFAKKTSIHRNTILNYLAGKGIFSATFYQLADAIDADPLELITATSKTEAKIAKIDEIRLVVAKIIKSDSKIAVILLGSRAKKKAKDYSDWDLGIMRGEKPLTSFEYLKIKGVVEEASEDIVRNIDVINLDSAPEWFLKEIDYEPIFLDGNKGAYLYFQGVMHGIKKKKE